MSGRAFLNWLRQFLSEEGYPPVPFDGLSPAEVAAAQIVEKECRKTDAVRQYSKVFLKTIDSSERFSEIAVRALSALTKVGYLGDTIRDIDVFCMHIAEIFIGELGLENCSVLLRHPSDGRLRLVADCAREDRYQSPRKEKKKFPVTIDEEIAMLVAGSGEHIFIPDVSCDSRCSGRVNGNTGISSLLSVPIKSGADVIGVINCSHPMPEAIDQNKINLILLLSNFTGQIITLITLHNKMAAWNESLKNEVLKKTAELRSKNARLHKLAVTDSLTGLYNRRFFYTRLEEEFSRALRYDEQFSLILIDLDKLKAINDTYGHVVGDKVIRRIAKCLKSSVRKGDVVGRLGGDEFGYIMLNANEELAFNFSKRLQKSLASVAFKEMADKPTMSMGIAGISGKKFKRYQDAYVAADRALYMAKKKRNCVTVSGKKAKKTQH